MSLEEGERVLERSRALRWPVPARHPAPGDVASDLAAVAELDEPARGLSREEVAFLEPFAKALRRAADVLSAAADMHSAGRLVCDWKLSQFLERRGRLVLVDVDGSEPLQGATCGQVGVCGSALNCLSRTLRSLWPAGLAASLKADRLARLVASEWRVSHRCGMPLWDERFDLWHVADAVNAAFGGGGRERGSSSLGMLQGLRHMRQESLGLRGEFTAFACSAIPHEDENEDEEEDGGSGVTCEECFNSLHAARSGSPKCVPEQVRRWLASAPSAGARRRVLASAHAFHDAMVAALRLRRPVTAAWLRSQARHAALVLLGERRDKDQGSVPECGRGCYLP